MQDWHTIPNVRDSLPWHKDKGRLQLNFFLSIIFVGMTLNGYDGSLIAGLQSFPAWRSDLGIDESGNAGALVGLLNAAGPISGFVVGPFICWVDETFGRRWGVRFYGYTLLIGTVFSCLAGITSLHGLKGYGIFIVGRFIQGFGLASFLMTSLVIVQEIPHPRSRAQVAASWDSYWILGSVLASWVNFGCARITTSWSWRIPYLIQIPMALYVLIAVQFVPETPRFLIGQGKEDEAFKFLVDYHGNGDPNDPLVRFEFDEMKLAIEQEREAKAQEWKVILKKPANRHRLFLAALMTNLVVMSGSSIVYYYYTVVFSQVGITSPTQQTGIYAGLSMFTWVCQIAAVYVGKFVGRKTIILSCWPLMLAAFVGLCACGGVYERTVDGNRSAGVATVALVWIYLGTFNFANPVLYSYPAEVQTFSMRSKGLLVWNTVTQLQGVYVTFVDSVALNKIGYKYYAVYMPLIIIQWFLVKYFMVETRGYTLEEVALLFDSRESLLDVPVVERQARAGEEEATLAGGNDTKKDDK
ncbi:hypothetical protein Q8F55_007623 [Vanrija albida]|uniref:Major facilitator superfamily (MFS) profile domain-containing protein n=1 Tax=Vanrija albida TaxID=181172 RepID=A0ABR3PU15_9TREE